MRKFLAGFTALLLIGTVFGADPTPPKTDPAITVPKALIVGPSSAPIGRMVILKMTGSVGDDPQITCTPKNTNWYQVRFNANELGVVFDTTTPGDYIFAFAVNKSGRTAIALHVVNIAGSTPPSPNTVLDLKTPYLQDLAAGVGVKGSAKLLAACYSQAPKGLFNTLKTNKDLQDAMHQLVDTTVGSGKLPNTRKAIAADVIAVLGPNSAASFNVQAATTEWAKIAAALLAADDD